MILIEEIDEPTVAAVVDVHMEAFRGYMNASIGREYVRRFLLWFARGPGTIAIAAADGGRVAGYTVGAPVGYDREMNRDLFWTVMRAIAVHPGLLFQKRFLARLTQRARRLFGRSRGETEAPPLPEPVMSLVGIGVSEAARGRGVGRTLLREFESRSRAARMKSMRLSVYADNSAACALYERAGWTLFAPAPGSRAVYYYRILEPENGALQSSP